MDNNSCRSGSKKSSSSSSSSCWRRRTALEKSLLIVVVIVVFAATVLAVVMVTVTCSGMLSGVERGCGGGDDDDEKGGHLANDVAIRTKRMAPAPATDRLRGGGLNGEDLGGFGPGAPLRVRRRRRRAPPAPCLRCQPPSRRRRPKTAFRAPLPSGSAFTRISRNVSSANKAKNSKSTDEICLSPDCIKIAARMMESVDDSVDPCEDFFEYACGTWNRINAIPDDRPTYSTFRQLDDQLQVILKDLLEAPSKPDEIYAITNAKNFYQSCLNTTIIEKRDDRPMKELLLDLGGWPVIEPDWDEERFNLTTVLARLMSSYESVLVHQWVGSDDKNSDVNILQMDQGSLSLPSREYFLRGRDDKTLTIYESFIVGVAQGMGASAEVAKRDAAQMVDFEIEVAKITIPEEAKRDMESMYNKFKLKDLYENLTDEIDWISFFSQMFSNASITIEEDEEIVVYTPGYFIELGKLLKVTPKRIVANCIIWRLVNHRAAQLSQRFLDMRRELNKALVGTEQERARWRFCVSIVNDNLGMAVGRMFVEKHFDEKAKTRALEMIQEIKKAFKEILGEVPWMDSSTRTFAQEKAKVMDEKIGYPDYIMNDTALNLDYEGVKSNSTQYFENTLNIMRVTIVNNHKQLRLPVERVKWSNLPAVVNAFYNAQKNFIMFPAAIFHPPFYHENYPMSLNFGGIGMVIGHEITHGFDDKGRQFDKNGNLKQWWTESDIEHFIEKAQCIVDQYSNYTIPEVMININGRLTQGENIADNGGLKQAYRGYKLWAKTHPPEPRLPGLNLSHDQLFFLNFAQVWCGTSRPESYVQSIRVSKHSPGKIRVIGSVSNSLDFAKAWSCPVGSRMNPVKKCSVW